MPNHDTMMALVASLLHASAPGTLPVFCLALVTGLIGVARRSRVGRGPEEDRRRIRRDFWGYD